MSSYRLRIALALKKLETEQAFVHLVRNGASRMPLATGPSTRRGACRRSNSAIEPSSSCRL
jgi:hypothetical protein